MTESLFEMQNVLGHPGSPYTTTKRKNITKQSWLAVLSRRAIKIFGGALTSSFAQFPGRACTVRIEWPGYEPSSPFHQNGGEFEAKFV